MRVGVCVKVHSKISVTFYKAICHRQTAEAVVDKSKAGGLEGIQFRRPRYLRMNSPLAFLTVSSPAE